MFILKDCGRKIASIDTDGHNFRLLVWEWNSKEIVAQSQVKCFELSRM